MRFDYDVIIVGAGVAGSSAAKALADKGWRTACIDRRTFPRHKVCGEFLSPEARITLDRLGLTETVEVLQPSKVEQARIVIDRGGPLTLALGGAAFGVSRLRLDLALHLEAERAGAQLFNQTMATSVQAVEDGYAVETRQGSERKILFARTVIAAWGHHRPWEGERKSVRPKGSSYIGLKSHYTGITMEPVVELYIVPGGYIGLMPVEAGKVNLAALIKRSTVMNGEPHTVEEMIETAVRSVKPLHRRLSQAVPAAGSQASTYPVVPGHRPKLWDGLPLIGDAALMIPPLIGDGMSIALYTAWVCAVTADRYLRGDIDRNEWQRQYTETVYEAVKRPLRWGKLLHQLTAHRYALRVVRTVGHAVPGLSQRLVTATRIDI